MSIQGVVLGSVDEIKEVFKVFHCLQGQFLETGRVFIFSEGVLQLLFFTIMFILCLCCVCVCYGGIFAFL